MIAEQCWGGRLCGDGWVFFTHENLHIEVFVVQEVVSYRNDLLPYLVSFCCTCTVAVVVLLHFSKYTYYQLWEYSDLLFSHSNMSSLVQPLFVCVYSMFRWHNSCCMQQTESHSWQLGQNKTQFRPSNRPVCVWNELLFIENVSQTSVCVTSSV